MQIHFFSVQNLEHTGRLSHTTKIKINCGTMNRIEPILCFWGRSQEKSQAFTIQIVQHYKLVDAVTLDVM